MATWRLWLPRLATILQSKRQDKLMSGIAGPVVTIPIIMSIRAILALVPDRDSISSVDLSRNVVEVTFPICGAHRCAWLC
jgi:hypothetical protein